MQSPEITADQSAVSSTNWGAVVAVAVGVAGLITAELLPVSLLTPMAETLGISEGLAGQSVTATALIAIFASLFITTLTRGIDRRLVVVVFSGLLVVSSVLAAIASNFTVLLIGRLLLGIALGGFWAMAASLALRLATTPDVPKALSIIFGGVSVAMVISAPIGSYLGAYIGWRGVFFAAAAAGIICLAWQVLTLPKMPAQGSSSVTAVFSLMTRPGVTVAMIAIFGVFAGQFAFFTYTRPFLENISGFGLEGVSFVLLIFGVANFIGTSFSSPLLKGGLKAVLAIAPLVIAASLAAMVMFGANQLVVGVLFCVWGLAFGVIPVGWSTWVTRNLGDDAENAGGLQVAVIQFANTAGAAIGGLVFDSAGSGGPALLAAVALLFTALIVTFGVQVSGVMITARMR